MKKKLRLLWIGFFIWVCGCAEMFQAPFSLFKELLPIAIKYAPYALMFLEVPETAPTEEPKQIESQDLPNMLQKELSKGQNKIYVIAVYLDSPEKELEIEKLAENYKSRFHVSYGTTVCDISNSTHTSQIQQILDKNAHAIFFANGPLQCMSNEQEWKQLAEK